MNVCQRIAAFRACMEKEGFSVVIVPTADSHASEYLAEYFKTRQWLCGFTGSAGTLVVGRDEAALFVDGRYFIQAEKQLEGSGVTLMKMGMAGVPEVEDYVLSLVGKDEKIGVDFGCVSAMYVSKLMARAGKKGAVLHDTGDWFADLWQDRPAMPDAKVFMLGMEQTGRSVEDKLAAIREVMKKEGATLHVNNVLDDIAWTLNVRGGDVLNTPVVMSYLVVSLHDAVWYVDEKKISDEIRAALAAAGVKIAPYESIVDALYHEYKNERAMLDGDKLTAKLFAAFLMSDYVLHENPAMRMKAIKNEVELANLRNAHIKDGAAVTRLMYWLKKNAGKVEMTELSVSEYLYQLRARQAGFISPSFNTICAYRANAAMMHYSATEESHAVIEPRDLLLIDSGGQYMEGTTDITRTFAMGDVSDEQKKHFTAVLVGMLSLQNAKFLHGCTGITLDILARGPMWDMGIDYRCGTGHGVGYLLGVHEGPNSFRWYKSPTRMENTVLEAGMVTTDEPGVYIEGSHGIRTENELVCVKLEENEYGQFMGFETITYCPIDLDAVAPELMTARQKTWLNDYHAMVREKLMAHMENDDERAWLAHATRAI
ncbi:MAG: aminopeptidase P family protein [Clostridia bacterium]|nr:aminopeptidase P family protein [Clostridia bacterium]